MFDEEELERKNLQALCDSPLVLIQALGMYEVFFDYLIFEEEKNDARFSWVLCQMLVSIFYIIFNHKE